MYSLDYIEDNVLEFLTNLVPQRVEEQAVPDIVTITSSASGAWKPLVTVQFGDLQPWGARSMVGARGDDYVLPIHIQVTALEASIARKVGNTIMRGFLGASFDWAGEVRKRVGGHTFPLTNSDGAIEAYISPLSFGLLIQLEDDVAV